MRSHIRKFIARTPMELKKNFHYIFSNHKPNRILFDHLHKCGGSSLNNYLETHYPARKVFSTNGRRPEKSVKEFQNLPQSKRYQYLLIKGHLANQLIDYIHPDHLKITLLRNPVDRIVSLYYYAKESPKHNLYLEINQAGMSLEDFATSDITIEVRNRYTTHFAGLSPIDVELHPKNALNTAINTIKEYDVIGFLDDFVNFTDSLRLQAELKYKYDNKRINVTKKRAAIDEIPLSVINTIKEINYLDLELYEKIRSSI